MVKVIAILYSNWTKYYFQIYQIGNKDRGVLAGVFSNQKN